MCVYTHIYIYIYIHTHTSKGDFMKKIVPSDIERTQVDPKSPHRAYPEDVDQLCVYMYIYIYIYIYIERERKKERKKDNYIPQEPAPRVPRGRGRLV